MVRAERWFQTLTFLESAVCFTLNVHLIVWLLPSCYATSQWEDLRAKIRDKGNNLTDACRHWMWQNQRSRELSGETSKLVHKTLHIIYLSYIFKPKPGLEVLELESCLVWSRLAHHLVSMLLGNYPLKLCKIIVGGSEIQNARINVKKISSHLTTKMDS